MSGMDAARGTMGQGWPFVTCPWSADGVNEPQVRSAWGRMSGAFLLGYFFLPPGGDPIARRSNSPCKAKPVAT